MTALALERRYARLAASDEPRDHAVAEAQLARLGEGERLSRTSRNKRSLWAHVPLADLFKEAGNRLQERRDGSLVCGHEPLHGSKSGTCVVIWPAEGRWWCSSCRRGGDAVTLLRDLHGWNYHHAAVSLRERFGPPARRGSPA